MTSVQNCFTVPAIMGPRQITGSESFSSSRFIDIISIPVDGIIVVTSPQELVSMIVEKAVKMAEGMNIPIVGIVENMSYFKCPDCNKEYKIFGDSNIDEIVKKHGLKVIAKLPVNPDVATSIDKGLVELCDDSLFTGIAEILEKEEWKN